MCSAVERCKHCTVADVSLGNFKEFFWDKNCVYRVVQINRTFSVHHTDATFVGFVAAAVSMSTGGCRARSSVGASSVAVVAVDIPIAAELAVL